jgi:acyl carrier protein phosphodiesterase
MTEPFLLGLVIGAIAGAIGARKAFGERNAHGPALARVEAKLDAILKHEGIRFDPYADAPLAVVEALRLGRKIDAIKEYRMATGAGLKEAKDYVEEMQRRATPRV